MGAVGTALPVKDAFGFFYNPAQLGYFGQTANVAVHGYPGAVDWLSAGIDWSSTAVSLGYDLEPATGVPFGIGMGLMTTEMDYGMFENVTVRDPTSPSGFRRLEDPVPGPRNEYNALGIGIGFDAGVGVHAGVTYKRPSARPSPLALLSRGEEVEEPLPDPDPVQTSAIDVGVMVSLPLSGRLADLLPPSGPFAPFARVALGYAVTNIGGEVDMPPTAFLNPIPRTAQLGYGISTGIDYRFEETRLRAAAIDWSVEAQDLLVSEDLSYQGPLGDISPLGNIVLAQGSDDVERRWGVRVGLAEMVQLSYGRMAGGGVDSGRTYGWGLRTKGFFKITAALMDDDRLALLARHVDVRYVNTTYSVGAGVFQTRFHGLSLLITDL